MHQDFGAFPMQAIQASLANLIPAGDGKKWPCAVNKRFLEMVSEKTLIAVVSSVDHEVSHWIFYAFNYYNNCLNNKRFLAL